MSTSLASLSADEVDANFEGLGDVFRMTDHLMGGENVVLAAGANERGWFSTYVHDENPRVVEFLDDPFWGNADGRHEKSGLLLYTRNEVVSGRGTKRTRRTIWTHFDDDIDQLGKLTLLVVVLKHRTRRWQSASCRLM